MEVEVGKDKKVFNIRALKRKERRQLRKEGINLFFITEDKAPEALDLIAEMIFTEEEIEAIDELAVHEETELIFAIIKHSIGSETELKN